MAHYVLIVILRFYEKWTVFRVTDLQNLMKIGSKIDAAGCILSAAGGILIVAGSILLDEHFNRRRTPVTFIATLMAF